MHPPPACPPHPAHTPTGPPKGQKFKHIDSRHRVGAVDTQKITFLASEKNRNKKTVCNFDTILKKHPSVLGTLIRHDSFFVGRWQARRSAMIAPQQRTGKNIACFCFCVFMRGTIDSCMAMKLPPIAASKFAAVRPGHMCHMSHAFASKIAFRYIPSPKS